MEKYFLNMFEVTYRWMVCNLFRLKHLQKSHKQYFKVSLFFKVYWEGLNTRHPITRKHVRWKERGNKCAVHEKKSERERERERGFKCWHRYLKMLMEQLSFHFVYITTSISLRMNWELLLLYEFLPCSGELLVKTWTLLL